MKRGRFFHSEFYLWFLLIPSLLVPILFVNIQAERRFQRSWEQIRIQQLDLDFKKWIPPEILPEENA